MVANGASRGNKTGKRKPIAKDVVLTGTGKTYYQGDPNMRANIQVNKNGSTVKVSGTISEIEPLDNAPFVSLEATAGPANTTDFLGGDSGGFSGFEVDITVFVADVTVNMNSYVLDERP